MPVSVDEILELDRRIAAVEHEIRDLEDLRIMLIRRRNKFNGEFDQGGLAVKICWSGPTYAHSPHAWSEDWFGGGAYWCPGASTDRT